MPNLASSHLHNRLIMPASLPQVKTITLAATDIDNDVLTYTLGTVPLKGSVAISGNVITYTPSTDESLKGADFFNVVAYDPSGLTSTSRIDLSVVRIADPVIMTV